MKKQTSKRLGNPAAVATVASVANSKTSDKIVDKGFRAIEKQQDFMREYVPKLFISGLVIAGVVFGPKLFKRWKRKNYAKKHIGDPNVQAAIIIRKSFTKLEFPGALSWVLDDLHLWTDEKQLFSIARKVTDLKEVSKAYNILFDSVLVDDLKNGFSSKEFQKFFDIIQGKEGNPNPMKVLPEGATVFSAMKAPMTIYEAVWDAKIRKWRQVNKLWKTVNYNDEIGKVHRVVKHSDKSRFYIIDGGLFKSGYGLVWDNKIKDTIN